MRLEDSLLEQAKREAARRHETLTALIEQGLRLVLARSQAPGDHRSRFRAFRRSAVAHAFLIGLVMAESAI